MSSRKNTRWFAGSHSTGEGGSSSVCSGFQGRKVLGLRIAHSLARNHCCHWDLGRLEVDCREVGGGIMCDRLLVAVNGHHPKDLPDFYWIDPVIMNLKTSFIGTFHALHCEKYADRYLGAICYRFNRRFILEEMTGVILRAVCNCNAK